MNNRAWLALAVFVACSACSSIDDPKLGADGTVRAPRDVAAPPADAIRTSSGLASKVIRVGLGRDHPSIRSQVLVTYTGWTPDGTMIDTSLTGRAPVTFTVSAVIPGWTEGLQLMVPGEKRRFWIPGALAYDNLTIADAPKGPLVFDIELLEIH